MPVASSLRAAAPNSMVNYKTKGIKMENVNNSIANNQFKGAALQIACEKSYYAQPYNLDAAGFYFSTLEEYENKVSQCCDRFGLAVEEFELMFIDGSDEEAQLFKACSVNQANLGEFLAIIEDVPAYQLPALFYLCDVHGYNMEEAMNKIDDVTIYTGELKDAAEELFDECYAHEIPDHLKNYIDYDAFARDCEMGGDMSEFEFAGTTYTVTNAASI